MPGRHRYFFDVDGLRIDDFPWRIHVHQFGRGDGPATAIVAGIIGDKPLGVLALHELCRTLDTLPVRGSVYVIPAANPFGLTGMMRHNPDLVELNRRFPGNTVGSTSDQLAHALLDHILERADCIIDVHSGTPVRKTHFAYDYGNLELTASFGYVPVMVDRHTPGQMCTSARAAGAQASLIEFGGASSNDTAIATDGLLNMLAFRGHIDREPTGPDRVEIIDQVKLFFASRAGALDGPHDHAKVGARIPPGILGWVTNVITGERLEEFRLEDIGERAGEGSGFDRWGPSVMRSFLVQSEPLLMVSQALPAMIQPGTLAFMAGWSDRNIPTPRR
ncbi:succinylglutamate desuccinylase/aspartoacylase family protein [Microvirga pudoricolor]|uniref:succinylglutamate desuccinylase/aspartoacylase family protein n=1 Tax=Microvirga pudoricolor TaxID=2778729 RepID=UPI00195005E2|nr:succinylglutamate desuccinylase/aspartoacylase family protein [Microvirga pudoricolor]MBM6595540.1 succinylglutamate desuccinylase/aspartoacylase family protein [Microvirga pudoricolor]